MESTDDPISEGPELSVLSKEDFLLETLEDPKDPPLEELLLHEGLPMLLPVDPLLAPLPELIKRI